VTHHGDFLHVYRYIYIKDNNTCRTAAAAAALGHAWQHLDQLLDSTTPNAYSTSTADSNLQHSAAPVAPMDSSSARWQEHPFSMLVSPKLLDSSNFKG
jgi:hypothetical protein